MVWPQSPGRLASEQDRLASEVWTAWRPHGRYTVGAVFVCFDQAAPGNGSVGDHAFAAAARGDEVVVVTGQAPSGYVPGGLALRQGQLLERATRGLSALPDVLIVDATGRDHPRRCGLALHLGAVVGVPTIGVTHRPLRGRGEWPADERGATSPVVLADELVGYWVRTKRGTRPLVAHAAWRTGPEVAVEVLLSATDRARSPEPLRRARAAARRLRGQQALSLL
jgi:deoxyribonuclease V